MRQQWECQDHPPLLAFLMAIVQCEATPLGSSESLSEKGATQSTLVELTPLEWESKVPESNVDE